MRIRRMRPADRPGIVGVYEARSRVSTGMMRRSARHWRRGWPSRTSKNLWLVAADRERVLGYAVGVFDAGSGGYSIETHWVPARDGTDLGEVLAQELLRRIRRRDPVAISGWVTAGSPALPIFENLLGHRRPPASVFMAGVVDPGGLLRDAARVVEHRVRERVRLRAGNRGLVTRGRGPVRATATFEPDALLGILLGIRSLDRELRRGIVSVRPRDSEARAVIARAFPPRSFHIQDAW